MEGSLSEGCKMDENQPSDLVIMYSGSRLMRGATDPASRILVFLVVICPGTPGTGC